MNSTTNISFQIAINAYLREVESTWKTLNSIDQKTQQLWQNLDSEGNSENLDRVISIELPTQGSEILIGVKYWSLTLRHQFLFPVLQRPLNHKEAQWKPIELAQFVSLTMGEEGCANHRGPGEINTLLLRCLISDHNTQTFIDHRREELPSLYDGRPLSFIDSEQSLLIGHQLHPVAKSREGFSSSELIAYSPETAERFQLHYFVADQSIVHQDSALKDSAVELVKQQLRDTLTTSDENNASLMSALDNPKVALIPVHPWQAHFLRRQPDVIELESQGLITYLGAAGAPFFATTSIRTVYGHNLPFMYKLSLNVRITNSERVNKSWELDRVLETARMMQLPVAEDIKATAPNFVIVNEPAYLSLRVKDKVLDGFSCILRDASELCDRHRDISAVTTLVQDNPLGGPSRLANIIHGLAEKERRAVSLVTRDWFDRYIDVTIEPLMKLFVDWGLCFEPHGQNTLVELKDGYPVTGFCRDGQGFFHRQAAHEDWCKIIPNKGEVTESIFPEDLARERLIYYPFINQVFSVINALGTQGLAEESELMAQLRQRMTTLSESSHRYPFSLLEVLENSERLPCKGNLLTQLYNMDELVGDIATQSVYITLPNIYRDSASS